jgi:nucleoside-diphosphate-sugar epimerase
LDRVNNEIIFLTGATGFVGANLLRKFLELKKFEVHIIIRESSNLWRINDLLKNKNLKIHYNDLNDFQILRNLVEKIKPDYILHLATYGAYPDKQTERDKIIRTNLLGTINLMEACQNINYKCFINTGSSSEYGHKKEAMSENDVLEPIDIYGVTKASTELYGHMLYRRYNKNIIHLRLFSVYGYYEEETRFIPSLVKAIVKNDKNINLTSGLQTRDFIFIEDIVEAYLRIIKMHNKITGETLNIGTGKDNSIRDTAKLMKKVYSSDIKLLFGAIKNRKNENYRWCADIKKMEKLLKWKPKHNLESGLRKTLDWMRKNEHIYER